MMMMMMRRIWKPKNPKVGGVALALMQKTAQIVVEHEMSLLTTILKAISPFVPDPVVGWGLREYFNYNYKSLGTMTTLQIDSTNKRASLDLELKGETQPLHITINHYELTSAGDKTFIEIKEITTSREWINSLAGPPRPEAVVDGLMVIQKKIRAGIAPAYELEKSKA